MNHYQEFITSTDAAAERRRIRFCPQCGSPLYGALVWRERQRCERCGYIAYLNPSPGVTAIVHNEADRVLIGKRSECTEYGGQWCLPGGYIEYKESFLDATSREVMEETGLSIRIEGIINVVSNLLDDIHHTLVIVLLAKACAGEPVPGDDVCELKWIDRSRHEQVDYAFEADKRIIDNFFVGGMEIIPVDERYRMTVDGSRTQ
jgi:8-oxo-dGTP diphosphatase